jgi:HPr kinase/phosphorylase
MKAKSVIIHASCIALDGQGVLLLGKSGAGKSDLALRLIHEGAMLVADDRTVLTPRGKALAAAAPASIKGLIEVRGLGIIALPARSARLALAVQLGREGPRLPILQEWLLKGLSLHLPLIYLDGRHASDPAKIALALRAISQGLFRDTFVLQNKTAGPK